MYYTFFSSHSPTLSRSRSSFGLQAVAFPPRSRLKPRDASLDSANAPFPSENEANWRQKSRRDFISGRETCANKKMDERGNFLPTELNPSTLRSLHPPLRGQPGRAAILAPLPALALLIIFKSRKEKIHLPIFGSELNSYCWLLTIALTSPLNMTRGIDCRLLVEAALPDLPQFKDFFQFADLLKNPHHVNVCSYPNHVSLPSVPFHSSITSIRASIQSPSGI